MNRLLFLTSLFILSVVLLVKRAANGDHASSASPMGAGDQEARAALKAWDLERMRDPATGQIPEDIRAKELAFAKGFDETQGPEAETLNERSSFADYQRL
jgi:hypothetical protein